ncbi:MULTISPECIES: hypothetical protein [Kitasatospora]|uniref:Uncharacterized protein n=2 Tax=Kitasatospora TaxID=2063 RepID=A0ABT1IQ42_9ACTN|nr:hypothetical protein [Kitasatospora paracochleata]MCP2307250.1 hypothetical protein [Kitasatospora paracochleata]
MSDAIGSPLSGGSAPSGLGVTTRARTQVETVREAYSFVCLSCAYGWEQAYDIEHHKARDGQIVFEYKANGVRVPSPLREPTCPGCGGHKVRIMREGRVATAPSAIAPGYAPHAEPADPVPAAPPAVPAGQRRRWFGFLGHRAD